MDLINAPGGGFKGLPKAFQLAMMQNASTLKPFLFASLPLPHADLVEIPGVGHPLEMIHPKDFNAAVLKFLENH